MRADPQVALGFQAHSTRSREDRVRYLYARHKQAVFRLALRYGAGNPTFAEDVTHDVFVRLLSALPRLSNDDDLGGWLYRVTTNCCLNRLRQEQVRNSVLRLLGKSTATTGSDLERETMAKHRLERVLTAIRGLPPKERIAIGMRHLDSKSYDEIAEVMGHSKGYISKLIHRAQARLQADGWEVADG